jgi:hypothetical protein
MRPLLRSILQILAATLATLSVLFGLAAALVTQPTFGILVAGRWSDRGLTRLVKKAILGTGFPAVSFTAPRDAGIDASDQRSYWDLGIPAVMVTDTSDIRNPHYHAPGDTAATLDYGRMARVVEGVAKAVIKASGASVIPLAAPGRIEHANRPRSADRRLQPEGPREPLERRSPGNDV